MSLLHQKIAARRQQILEAARRLIESEGYEGLTMRSLAVESGVTVPTVYNLIGNKEQVLFDAVEDQTRAFVSNLDRLDGDLIAVFEATVRQLIRRPRYYRALLLLLANSERADSARRHVGRALAEQIAISLAKIDHMGELAKWVDPDVLAQRLHAHLDMASLEWARGSLTATSFRSAALFDVATSMLGVSSGESRNSFERIIRDQQAQASHRHPRRGRSNPRNRRGRAA
jgi:AcrR family transcriptional regulator